LACSQVNCVSNSVAEFSFLFVSVSAAISSDSGSAIAQTAASLIHAIDVSVRPVVAVTSFGDLLFVARSDQREIEVYDATTFTMTDSVTVHGLGSRITGLASGAASRCIFIADWDNKTVHRCQYSRGAISKLLKWRVVGSPQGLSTLGSLTYSLIVTCIEGKLFE
jgi:hypothetical protein